MQYIPGNDSIWVERLNPQDPVYEYDMLEEAEEKLVELKSEDPTRGFKIVEKP